MNQNLIKISEAQFANVGGFIFRNGKDENYYKACNLITKQLKTGWACEDCGVWIPVFMVN